MFALSGCGGSSSENSEGEHHPMNDTNQRQYENEDSLQYVVNQSYRLYNSDGNETQATASGSIDIIFFTGYVGDGEFYDSVELLIKRLDRTISLQGQVLCLTCSTQNRDYGLIETYPT